MGLFGKADAQEKIEIPDDAEVGKKVELMNAALNKISIQIESLNEVRRSSAERFAAITEQIGELRGQLLDTNRTLGNVEVKAIKASDLVSAVHPEKLMIELQKEDGKVEAIKASIESNEAMMHNLMDQLKKLRSQTNAFRGLEQVIKLNEEVKAEIMNIKRIAATVEKHSDKVETIFADFQKTYHEYNIFADTLDEVKKELTQISGMVSTFNVRFKEFVEKRDFESRIAKFESVEKQMKKTLTEMEYENKKLKRNFELTRNSIVLQFEKEFASARIMSSAFERLLMDNPEMAKNLAIGDYIEQRKAELDVKKNEVEKEQQAPLEQQNQQ